jgi:hypothetical protein
MIRTTRIGFLSAEAQEIWPSVSITKKPGQKIYFHFPFRILPQHYPEGYFLPVESTLSFYVFNVVDVSSFGDTQVHVLVSRFVIIPLGSDSYAPKFLIEQ